MAECWKPLASEKDRLKLGAAIMPLCDEAPYMRGCDDEPEGNEDASAEFATCILRGRMSWCCR